MRIENNIKGHYIEKPPKLNHAGISLSRSSNFDAANNFIKWFTVIYFLTILCRTKKTASETEDIPWNSNYSFDYK